MYFCTELKCKRICKKSCQTPSNSLYSFFCDSQLCPGRCGEFKDCVLCEVHKRGPKYDAALGTCTDCVTILAEHPIIVDGKIEGRSHFVLNYYICCMSLFAVYTS